MPLSRIVLFTLVAAVFSYAYVQELGTATPISNYVITNYTADNGLPQNTVDLITQTSDGYIWIGTYAGLARYDGIKFIHFNRSITPAFKINHVTTLIEDKNGVVWIGTNGGGIVRYAKHQFTAIEDVSDGGKEYIRTFLYDGNNSILVGTERGGIQKLLIGDDGAVISASEYSTEELPQNYLLRTIVRDQLNRILLATDLGLVIIDNDKSRTMTVEHGLPNNSITALAVDQHGVIWAGTANGLARIQNDKIRIITKEDGLTTNAIRTLFVDNANALWIGTDGGGIIRCIENGEKLRFDHLTVEDGLVNNYIRTIFQDNEENIWIGTRNGLTQIHQRKFELYGKKYGLSDSYVRTVYQDSKNRLWVGTNGNGLNRLDKDGITIWNSDKELPNKFIRALFQDKNGIMWIGTDGGGVVRFDEQKKSGKQFTTISTEQGLTENYIRSIQEGFENDIWIATYGGGICRMKGDSIIPLTTQQGLANDNVLAMVKSNDNVMWVGTNGGGINKITPGKIETITSEQGLSNNFILSLYVDHEGVVWAGTNGGGINRISNGTVQVFSTKDGLREDVTLMMMEDNRGYLWIGGNQGITRIRKSDFQEVYDKRLDKFPKIDFGRSDGLQNAEISGVSNPCIIKSTDGEIWFTTVGGLARVNPDQMIAAKKNLPLHIEEIRYGSKKVYPDSTITIEPGVSSIEFHYTALSYIAPDRIRFRYKLIGFDEEWVDVGPRRTAYYTNLQPGQYTFSVSTSADDGSWSDEEVTTSIVLQPFFYQTRYFIAIVGFGLVLMGAGLYALRTASIHRHAKHLKSVVEEKTKDLVAAKEKIEVHLHEVEMARDELSRINLRLDKTNKEKSDLLGILSHDFKNKVVNLNHFARTITDARGDLTVVQEHSLLIEQTTQYMLRMIEDTLSSSALEQGQLVFTKARIDIVQLTELVVLKNQIQLQQKKQIINFQPTVEKCIVSGSERWLNEAIDNLINNASKFSNPDTAITVSIDMEDSKTIIKVIDQGPGLTEDDKKQLFQQFKRLTAQPTGGEVSTGLGLAIVKKIVEMHNGRVWAESTLGNGSTFGIELPVYRPL